MPLKKPAADALQTCKSLGASMFMPKTSKDIDAITHEHEVTSATSRVCRNKTWIPVYKKDLGVWVHLEETNKFVKDELALFDQVDNGKMLQQCLRHSAGSNYTADVECVDTNCFMCSWDGLATFTLKGLKPGSIIETRYMILEDYHEGILGFEGFGEQHFIIYEKNNMSWLLVEKYNFQEKSYGKIHGMFSHPTEDIGLPIGLHTWIIDEEELQLKLTVVS